MRPAALIRRGRGESKRRAAMYAANRSDRGSLVWDIRMGSTYRECQRARPAYYTGGAVSEGTNIASTHGDQRLQFARPVVRVRRLCAITRRVMNICD